MFQRMETHLRLFKGVKLTIGDALKKFIL